MSFFGDLVSSIGGDRAPAPPVKASVKSLQTAVPSSNGSKSGPTTPTIGSQPKPVYKGTAGITSTQQGNSLKRKAEEDTSDRPRSTKPNGNDVNSPKAYTGTSKSSSNIPSNSKPPPKAPAKGSYAEIMARAKEAQSGKVPSQVGMIKHQATDKVKTSKLAERKREEQEKGKSSTAPQNVKAGQKSKIDQRRRSVSPAKRPDASVPKQPKAPRPPLHGPPPPAYKGTMNTAPKKPRQDSQPKRHSKYDEYLGTDEEEDSDEGGYGDEQEYYSDESEIMDAKYDDVEAEEYAADRYAREEDARELALENRLKKEKLERKQKLAALASKKR